MNKRYFLKIFISAAILILVGYIGSISQEKPKEAALSSPIPSSKEEDRRRSLSINVALKFQLEYVTTTENGDQIIVDNTSTENLLQGDRIGIVRNISGEAFEVASIDASSLMDEIAMAKKNGQIDFTSSVLHIELPDRPRQNFSHEEYIVIFYKDNNSNDRFDPEEPFIGNWTGGTGSFELQFFREVTREVLNRGALKGWNIVEGGHPQVFLQNFNDMIFFINPTSPPISN